MSLSSNDEDFTVIHYDRSTGDVPKDDKNNPSLDEIEQMLVVIRQEKLIADSQKVTSKPDKVGGIREVSPSTHRRFKGPANE